MNACISSVLAIFSQLGNSLHQNRAVAQSAIRRIRRGELGSAAVAAATGRTENDWQLLLAIFDK